MSNYPARIDDNSSLPLAIDNATPVSGSIFNKLRSSILAVESELGVKPSGINSTVKARLDNIENTLNNLSIITIAGDLGGNTSSQIVIGIQGRPVTTDTPAIGESYVWNGIAWEPQAPPTVTFDGDVHGTSTTQTVTGIQNRTILANAPSGGQALVWDGSFWRPRNILQDDVSPPLILEISTTPIIVQVSQTVTNPSFIASYSFEPDSATLTDDINNTPQDVTSTADAFSSDFSFTRNLFGEVVTFSLEAIQLGYVTKTTTCTITWGVNTYYGIGPAGQTGEAFVESLTAVLAATKVGSFTVTAGPFDKIYFSCRGGYSDVFFTVNGITGGFTKVDTFPVTNAFGWEEDYDLYESDSLGLGEVTIFTS